MVLEFRRDWGRDYVAFYDESERVVTIPIAWTDLEGEGDPFVVLSGCRAYFRPVDLLVLVDLIESDRPSVGVGNAEGVASNVVLHAPVIIRRLRVPGTVNGGRSG